MCLIEIGGQQLGVARLHAAVAAHVQVPALLGGDDSDILALGLGALAGATRDGEFDLVGRAQAPVAVLDLDREADAVLHSVAAPCRADAGLHRAHGFPVGVPGLESGGDEVRPDERQLVHLRAEQVDPLSAGDLGVEAELAGDLADGDELLRRDLAAGHARHDRVGAVFLHVGEKVVVRVLQRGTLAGEHEPVPTRGQNGGHGGFADVATQSAAVCAQQLHRSCAAHRPGRDERAAGASTAKCSHKWLSTATPLRLSSDFRICVTREAQPPHDVAALVFFLMAPMVVQPASTAAQIAPLETLLHEQIWASAGSAASPLRRRVPGCPAAAEESTPRDIRAAADH